MPKMRRHMGLKGLKSFKKPGNLLKKALRKEASKSRKHMAKY